MPNIPDLHGVAEQAWQAQVLTGQARRDEALRLRQAGWTLVEIGRALGVSKARAGQLCADALKRGARLEADAAPVSLDRVRAATPTERLPLPHRLRKALMQEGIASWGMLLEEPREMLVPRLLRTPNIDRKGVTALMDLLAAVEQRGSFPRELNESG